MFRYLALAWNPAAGEPAALAGILTAFMRARRDWTVALERPGLAVFVTGTGANRVYPLHGGSGAVVGRVFHRQDPQREPERVAEGLAASNAMARDGGRTLLTDYWGRYVAFLEAEDGRHQVLRDPSGALPCYRLRHEGVSFVFSWLEDVLQLPRPPAPRVSQAGIASYLAFAEVTGRLTALEGVIQILAGEVADIRSAEAGDQLLWDMAQRARSPMDITIPEARDHLRAAVRDCVEAWTGCYDPILLRLSGGVDSAILAACMAQARAGSRVACLNYHSPGADSDEREYARQAANAAGFELIEQRRNSMFRLEQVLTVARTPTPTNYVGRISSPTDADIAARVGATAMFTGSGGDQLFFEFKQSWPAADYLRLHGLNAGFLSAAMESAQLGKVSVWKAAGRAIADRFRVHTPMQDSHVRRTLITDDVHHQAAHAGGYMHPAFFDAPGLPIGKLNQVHQLAYFGGYYDPYARERAPELVNPLLSQPLIELCLALPTFQLTHQGRGRGLARLAFANDLPPQIAKRRSKGGMDEHTKAVLAGNLDFAREMLLDGELVRRRLLNRKAIESALSGNPASKTNQSGELHMCISAEVWLRRMSGLTAA